MSIHSILLRSIRPEERQYGFALNGTVIRTLVVVESHAGQTRRDLSSGRNAAFAGMVGGSIISVG